MSKDSRQLFRILQRLPHVTQFHIRAASILLAVSGLESALIYIEAIYKEKPFIMPFEAAETLYFEQIECDEFF